ncbi:hypothetical protein [Streptodolium elevatio]|uniref:Uncharacterized protein n=1 Tax=Streptodolium elevatio TaxID=3157996 RepID=A0ABV3DE13_9ACTN
MKATSWRPVVDEMQLRHRSTQYPSNQAPLRDPGYGQIYGNNGRYQT